MPSRPHLDRFFNSIAYFHVGKLNIRPQAHGLATDSASEFSYSILSQVDILSEMFAQPGGFGCFLNGTCNYWARDCGGARVLITTPYRKEGVYPVSALAKHAETSCATLNPKP